MNPYITQQLAAGRQAELRRNAEHHRLVKQASEARREDGGRRSSALISGAARFGRAVRSIRAARPAPVDCSN